MEVEEGQTKQPLLQCKFCARHYPAEFRTMLVTHLQWHIEQSARQPAANHRCPWNPSKRERHIKEQCGNHFHRSEDFAIHILEKHTKTRYVGSTTNRYREAWENSIQDKAHLIEILSQMEETPDRLFFQAENRNGPQLRIDNMDFQLVPDNIAHIRLREGLH